MRPEKKRRLRRWLIAGAIVAVLAVGGYGAYVLWLLKPTQAQIDEAIANEEWRLAAFLITRTDLSLDNGRNHFHLGNAYRHLGDEERAIEAFMQADDRRYARTEARYRIATLYAKLGERDLAMQWMRDALDAGYALDDLDDPHLAQLASGRDWERFFAPERELEGDPERALDFMLGSWTVSRGGFGSTQSVTVTKPLPGYVTEDWQLGTPGNSTGAFLFDPVSQRWGYTFVDGFGRVFEGDVRATGRLVVVTGEIKYIDGTSLQRRVEVRASGGVVDYVVQDSRDGGQTWDREERRRLTLMTEQGRPSF
jgi:hypothetical protein